LGSIGGVLVIKFVKQTKVFCSWASYQRRFGQILPTQTEADIGTAGAGVLREPNTAVGKKLGGFDPANGVWPTIADLREKA